MSSRPQSSPKVCFGEFELDVQTAELRSNGTSAVLPGKPFQILVTLLDRPGQLITREELKRQLWPSDTFVDFDVSLNKAVNRLREALGDSAENPRFVETLPRKGYRFIGEIGNGARPPVTESAVPHAIDNPGTVNEYVTQATANHADQRVPLRLTGSKHVLRNAITILVIAIVVVAISKLMKPRHPDLSRAQITKLTDSGRAQDVAISPDGRYVVYALNGGEEESLHLRHTATQSDVEILPSGPGFHGLTFSPDGNYIYVVRSDPKDPYFKYLYSVPALGGSARRMIADVDSPVTFSPDGQQFAFERAVLARNVIELRVANVDGTGEHVLATMPNGDAGLFQPGPSWSRDGKTIVCPFRILGKEIRWILVSVSVSSGTTRQIYSDQAPFGRPVWLTDGNLLVPRYDSAYGRWQLWTISYPGGEARRFTNDVADYDQPLDISRDGNTVVAIATSVSSNIWEAFGNDLSRARQVTSGGLPMIYVAETGGGQLLSSGGDGQVWKVKPDGKREIFSELHDVRWLSRCGSLIVFTSFEANAITLTRVNEDGSHLLRLFSGDLAYQGCSPDGRFAYYVNRHRPQKIWKLSMEGGPPTEVAPGMGEGINGWLDVSPNGAMVSYTFDQYRPVAWKIAVIPETGGDPLRTFDVPGRTTRVRWSPAGTALQYLVTQNGVTNIWEQSLKGGEPKQLTKFTSEQIFDFNWSLDHRSLFLTRGAVTSDVVWLSNLR